MNRLASNPLHPYFQIFRLCDNGIRVPVYRSRVFDKMNRSHSEVVVAEENASEHEEEEEEDDEDDEPEQAMEVTPSSRGLFRKLSTRKMTGGYCFGRIEFPNQLLLNDNKHAVLLIEVYETTTRGRDLYVGHCEVGLIPA